MKKLTKEDLLAPGLSVCGAAALPAASAAPGTRAMVTDSDSDEHGKAVKGGGSHAVQVKSVGGKWEILPPGYPSAAMEHNMALREKHMAEALEAQPKEE